MAHGLGHHFLHGGNRAYLDGPVTDQLEIEAETFAAMLLIPSSILPAVPKNPRDLSNQFKVPENLAARRIEIAGELGI